MEIETLQAMNEHLYLNLLMMFEVFVRVTIIFAIFGFAFYIVSIVWLCFEETRQPARRQVKLAPKSAESDECDQLAGWAAPDQPGRIFYRHRVAPRIGVTTNFN